MVKLCGEKEFAELREKVIRECIAALPECTHLSTEISKIMCNAVQLCRKKLNDLLPKPDKAKDLVDEYRQTFQRPDVVACDMDNEMDFARWLIESGKL